MSKLLKSARPIQSSVIKSHYDSFNFKKVSIDEYAEVWRDWLTYTENKSLHGLDNFKFAEYTQGTAQTFDNFVMRYAKDRTILALRGDFQYHACISKFSNFEYIDEGFRTNSFIGRDLAALIISAPFSDFGCMHPDFDRVMDRCAFFSIPVCLDLAYWGISKNIHINLDNYPMIKEVTCSLSKPFYALENHRVGIRFTRDYADDGISIINEVGLQNDYSISLGAHFMRSFSPDWNWETFGEQYEKVCEDQDLVYTDTVIFGLGSEDKHKEFNRGNQNNYRVCISEFLGDIN